MKSKIFLLILSLTLIAYNTVFFQSLSGNYNINALVVSIDDVVLDRVEKFKETTGSSSVMISYQKKHGSGTLYMNAGNLGDFETVELLDGNWALNGDRPNIVIGDEIADAYFSQLTCLNRTFVLAGTDYKVVGVAKNSDDIYIGFNEDLKQNYWEMKELYILPPNQMSSEDYLELLPYDLNQNLIAYSEITLVKWQMDIFKNIALLISISIFTYFIASLIRTGMYNFKSIAKHYMSKRNDTEIIDIFKPIWQEITYLVMIVLGLVMTVIIVYIGMINLSISANYLPQNLFSAESFYDLLERHSLAVLNGMKYGMGNLEIISIGAIVGQLALSLFLCIAYLLKFSWREKT